MPVREDWKRLAADDFRDYRLKVGGLVENPVELSLSELRALGMEEFVTMHHCIQGWTGIAQWRGVPMQKLVDLVKPTPAATRSSSSRLASRCTVAAITRRSAWKTSSNRQCLLALEMNGNRFRMSMGALRLRVENQLGYKMVKWIERIEFVESEKHVGEGRRRQERRRRILRSAAEHLNGVIGSGGAWTSAPPIGTFHVAHEKSAIIAER